MYELHYRRWYDTPKDFTFVGNAGTLEEAKALRKVSGDLVVFAGTFDLVFDPEWLFDWEKVDPKSYARKAIRYELCKQALAVA